jgi:hypothetical protein
MKDPSDTNKPATLGARSEDSSLFSLDALKLKEAELAKQSKTKEDSGLIDLRALASLERSAEKPAALDVAPVVAPADLFGGGLGTPLIAPPPAAGVAAPPADYAAPAPKKSSTGLIIGGAVGAIGIAVAVFALTRGGGAPPAATAQNAAVTTSAAAAAPAPQPSAEPAAAEQPTVAAVTPGQRPAQPTAAPTAAPAPAPEKPAPVAKAPGPMPKPKAAAPAEPAPPPKPVETCDLACQMQRAVNKKK